MKPCTICGAPVPPGARFCPKCGTAVVTLADSASEPAKAAVPVPPPTAKRPVESRSSAPWWVVPMVIVGLIVIAWVVMANMPDRGEERVGLPEVETVQPGVTPAETGTLVEMNGDDTTTRTALQPPMIIEEVTPPTTTYVDPAPPPYAAPPVVIPPVTQPQPAPTPTPTPALPPVTTTPPPAATQPRPAPVSPPVVTQDPPPPSRPAPAESRISEGEAVSRVRQYVASRRVYDTSTACTSVRSRGLINEGYTIEVWDSCAASGGSRRLGRWRVDVKTGEIFRQRDDGRYLAP
jgi:hypothetical protein